MASTSELGGDRCLKLERNLWSMRIVQAILFRSGVSKGPYAPYPQSSQNLISGWRWKRVWTNGGYGALLTAAVAHVAQSLWQTVVQTIFFEKQYGFGTKTDLLDIGGVGSSTGDQESLEAALDKWSLSFSRQMKCCQHACVRGMSSRYETWIIFKFVITVAKLSL